MPREAIAFRALSCPKIFLLAFHQNLPPHRPRHCAYRQRTSEVEKLAADAAEQSGEFVAYDQKTWTYAELTAITEQEIERLRLEVDKLDHMPKLQQQSAIAAYVTYRFWVTLVAPHYPDWMEDGERLENLVSRCFDAPLPEYLIGSGISNARKRKY
jgi:hypothetical protein